MKAKLCRKCGKPFKGYGTVCDCVMEQLDFDRRGQRSIFGTSKSKDLQDDIAYLLNLMHLPPEDREVPPELLEKWMKERCVSRKTKDDWGGLVVLHRHFTAWAGDPFTLASFQDAVMEAGFAMNRGMVSKLILKEDK